MGMEVHSTMGESKARKAWEARIAHMRQKNAEDYFMNGIPVVCSKCQGTLSGIPGSAHDGCGGTFVPAGPVQREFKFSSPIAMQIFMMLDRLVNDVNYCAGQFNFMKQEELSNTVSQLCKAAIQLRDSFYQHDQSRILIVGPGAIPPNGAPKA